MKGSVARKIRNEMEKYRKDADSPIVPMHDRVFGPLGVKGEVLVPVNHTRRARKHVKKLGDLKKGIAQYGKGLVNNIMESRKAEGDINALDKLAEDRKEKKARRMSRGAITNAIKKKPKEPTMESLVESINQVDNEITVAKLSEMVDEIEELEKTRDGLLQQIGDNLKMRSQIKAKKYN